MDASGDGTAEVDIDGKPLEEVEVFDDADFYQQLLRDVIDGQASNGKMPHIRQILALIPCRIWG